MTKQVANFKAITTLDTRSESKKKIDDVKSELDVHLEAVKIQCTIARKQFNYLVYEGFTESQAMEIITKQPSWK